VTLARRPWLYVGPAALVAGAIAVALTVTSDHEPHPALATALGLFVSWSFIFAGLIGWSRRPTNRTGMLMVAVGFGVLVGSLSEANYSGWTFTRTQLDQLLARIDTRQPQLRLAA
jgi:hypothetical protein